MIRLIAAVDQRNGIGKNGGQPWNIPQDETYFSEQTKKYGANVLVGNTTYKTFNGPLTERINYVLTSNRTSLAGSHVVHDLTNFLQDFDDDLWVIGGAALFKQVIDAGKADELYLTHIAADFGCSHFFPDYKSFTLIKKTAVLEQNGFKFSYAVYSKA